jgi:hypothetical protein
LYVPPVNAEASAKTWIDVGECPVAADVLNQPPLESVTENGSDGMKLRIVRDSTLPAAELRDTDTRGEKPLIMVEGSTSRALKTKPSGQAKACPTKNEKPLHRSGRYT